MSTFPPSSPPSPSGRDWAWMRNAAASGATYAVKFGSKKNGTLQGSISETSSTTTACFTWRGGVQERGNTEGLLGRTDWRKGYVRDPVIATSMDNPVQCRFVHSICPRLPHFSDVADNAPRHWAGRDPDSLLGTCSLGSVGESSLPHHRTCMDRCREATRTRRRVMGQRTHLAHLVGL